MFRRAGQAEILRSNQKDEFYISYLRSTLSETFQSIVGMRSWIHLRKELEVFADFTYFLLTTAAGFQTLGEEYVNIIQVDGTLRAPVSTMRRSFMILLHVWTPYVFQRFFDKCQKDLMKPDSSLRFLSLHSKEFLIKMIPVVKQCMLFCHRFHLTAFYLRGIFYHIAKRLLGVHYIQFTLKPKTRFGIFWLLGWLTASQLLGGVLISAYQFHKTLQDLKSKVISSPLSICKVKSVATASSHQCPLCLELRHETTVTPCGHLFCWSCILEWCQTKGECPLCREKLLSCRLIYLQNYDF
ncbi:peroxisome biogenesis factor 10 isoform X2 [Octopus sinensis]|nr:peroxisome biogenesis factor 10 isoform X2 [Octopus sinensis]XP_036366163.1 peroxisome biogenesis factor 10 isoform X2 [Octopus sinensis]